MKADVAHALVTILSIIQLGHVLNLLLTDEYKKFLDELSNAHTVDLPFVRQMTEPLLAAIYSGVGLKMPNKGELISTLRDICVDLGLSDYPTIEAIALGDSRLDELNQSALIRLDSFDRTRLFKIDLIGGAVVASVNRRHPYVVDCLNDEAAMRSLAKLALGYGSAASDMFGSADQIQAFTGYLGLALAKSVRQSAVEKFVAQAVSTRPDKS